MWERKKGRSQQGGAATLYNGEGSLSTLSTLLLLGPGHFNHSKHQQQYYGVWHPLLPSHPLYPPKLIDHHWSIAVRGPAKKWI